MFLALFETGTERVRIITRGTVVTIATSWILEEPRRTAKGHQRVQLAPGIVLVRVKQWLPTTVLDVAEQLPYDLDVKPAKRVLPFPEWHRQAACLGVNEAVFFGAPATLPPFSRGALRTAREICRTCPVARTCLTEALTRPEEYGVWAGTSGGQRARLALALRAGADLDEVVEVCLTKLSRSARPRRASLSSPDSPKVTPSSPTDSPLVA